MAKPSRGRPPASPGGATTLQRARRRQARQLADVEPDDGSTAPEPGPRRPPDGTPLGRIGRSLIHPGRGQVLAAVILFVVGLGGVMQVRSNRADDTYASARREDLVQLLDGLTEESRQLDTEVADLQQTKRDLQSGAGRREVARQEAAQRIDALSILAGTVPARGPGIRITIVDPAGKVNANVLLDAVEEMRDAGAEVIEYSDSVRVVASTSFTDTPGGVVVDGVTLGSPFTIEAIGDANALTEAANFRGGLVSEVTGSSIGGQATVIPLDDVRIDSLHTATPNQYAQPASTPTPR
ncbi:MAG: DUF881 domain-containing protein [Propionibacteriaceae bacterium]